VLVMGYWLGSELVINALTHYIARTTTLSGAERMRLWDFLLDVDQHVRNAMIMSVPLGFSLAGILGRLRYVLMALFGGTAVWSLLTGWPLAAPWLAWKVLLFVGCMACGIAVRYYIRAAYRSAIPAIAADRATPADNAEFAMLMRRATWALVVLWVLLFTIGALGALKPYFG